MQIDGYVQALREDLARVAAVRDESPPHRLRPELKGVAMFQPPPPKSAAHWVYDDPSGVPEAPFTVSLPEPLREPVELAAARAAISPSDWLALAVSRSLRPASTVRAI